MKEIKTVYPFITNSQFFVQTGLLLISLMNVLILVVAEQYLLSCISTE